MNIKKLFLGLFIMGTVATTFTSCRSEGEKVADDIEDVADDVGDAVD
ncbi:hypothetical protein ACFQ3R_08950 [Mesonia ostreae]|uniref:Uncharacterized protein n=1 Tax=Mesonia ostreae TaxID=861110 RepID=A0ABU2KES8_9FLAO|nr:hypothetical protein [Mesonia ostreae]MDT0293204.1 hypothetical protein [Mesonia ostreae]